MQNVLGRINYDDCGGAATIAVDQSGEPKSANPGGTTVPEANASTEA